MILSCSFEWSVAGVGQLADLEPVLSGTTKETAHLWIYRRRVLEPVRVLEPLYETWAK